MSRRPVKSAKPKAFRQRLAELDILAIGARGDGLAKLDGEQVFVPLSLPGDRVVVRLEGRRGDGLTASLTELITPGPSRREPPCPLFGRCGGCNLQHVSDAALAEWKHERLVTAMTRVDFDSRLIAPLVSIPPGTRRRAAFAFTRLARGLVIGFNERASHHLIEVDPCLILSPSLLAILDPLRAVLGQILPVGTTGDVVATATDSGLDLVIQTEHQLDLFARETLASFADNQDLARLSWQRGDLAEPVAHRRPAQVTMGEVPVDIPPGGFLQPSREGEAALVSLIQEYLPEKGAMLDLYAGSGSFTFPMAQGRAVTAVEGDAAAIGALGAAARRQGLSVTAIHRDLARQPLLAQELKPFAGLVFDPPRAGAAAQAEQIARGGPPVVVAVSCNPATLARDAALLADGGYKLVKATPVDQFPWSAHLEAVAVFQR
jgi:23S rRNA (uracil1939-C5)-methyltransferase